VFKQAAGNDKDAAATLVGLGYVRMLATVGADGRIGWDIDVVDKHVTVNGQALPGAD
jgi:hypothetical protein